MSTDHKRMAHDIPKHPHDSIEVPPKATLRSQVTTSILVGGACLGIGYLFNATLAPVVGSKMLPWALGRALGITALVELWALVVVGMWFRSPLSRKFRFPSPSVLLRTHQTLAMTGAAVLAIHIISLILDSYAGVGVVGAFVPGASSYRTFGVALGTLALYLGLLIGGSAALAGVVGRHWRNIHQLALLMFASAWLHGITSGSDAVELRPLYLFLALSVMALVIISIFGSRTRERTT